MPHSGAIIYGMVAKFSRPINLPASQFEYLPGGDDPSQQHAVAETTAWALLHRVRTHPEPKIVARILQHAATSGVDDMAQLWQYASPKSLPGVLWRLYLLRRAAQINSKQIADFYRAGMHDYSVESVVAGVSNPATPESVVSVCEQILSGIFVGDFAVALDRAWGYCRVVAIGAAHLATQREQDDPAHAQLLTKRSARYLQISQELAAAAAAWRNGTLD